MSHALELQGTIVLATARAAAAFAARDDPCDEEHFILASAVVEAALVRDAEAASLLAHCINELIAEYEGRRATLAPLRMAAWLVARRADPSLSKSAAGRASARPRS